jgi:eukaryotic-like serine/threonine-protein kinase
LGKPDEALSAYNQALKIRRDIGAKKEVGDTLNDLGDFYLERGQPDQALQVLKESLQIQRDAGDETNQGLCLNNIANAYSQKGENEDALTYLQQSLQIREKLNVPGNIAQTLQTLGMTYAALGQYDSAMTSFMRGLDLYRKSGDNLSAAGMSHSIGLVFQYQGRIGAAVSTLQDAVKTFRDSGDRSGNTAQALADLADALAQAGRGAETPKLIDEAQSIERDLKNDSLTASILNSHGDAAFYQGDLKSAGSLYEQASRVAAHSGDKDEVLTSKLNLIKVAVADGHSRAAVHDLRSLEQQADRESRKYISVAAVVLRAQAMIENKDYAAAQKELQKALGRSEKMGLHFESMQIHYLLGTTLKLTGHTPEAATQYSTAGRLLDEISKEQGAEHLADRYDLKPIYSEVKK